MKKKLLVILLAIAILVIFMPVSAYAGGHDPGWYQDAQGYRYYYDNNGNLVKGWITVKDNDGRDARYYADPGTGRCITGWKKLDGYWYYFWDYSGRMCDQGVEYLYDLDKGITKLYYFATKHDGYEKWGRLQYGWVKEEAWEEGAPPGTRYYWYYADPANDGQLTVGWKKINNQWYYFRDTKTLMRAKMIWGGPCEINGNYYMFGDRNDGALRTGWIKATNRDGDTVWYYADPKNDSRLAIGWRMISGTWYHFSKDCVMSYDAFVKDSTGWMYLGSDGKPVYGKWIRYKGEWYYIKKNGYMAAGEWARDNTGWLWMDADGKITKDKWIKYNSEWYYLKPDGYMASNEWADDSIGRCWLNGDGTIARGRVVLFDADIYYVDENGYMVTDKTVVIDGAEYYFGPDGRMTAN